MDGMDEEGQKRKVCLFVGCLTSQQHASVPQGRTCTDNFTCCHTEIEVADPTFYLTQSQYTDTGPTSPSADPIMPGAWQGSHWSVHFEVTGMTRPPKNPVASGIRTQDLPLSRPTPYPLRHRGGQKGKVAQCCDRDTENKGKQFCIGSWLCLEASEVFWAEIMYAHMPGLTEDNSICTWFCMRWSFFSLLSGRLTRRELQWFNLVSMKEPAGLLAASVEKMGWIWGNLPNWQKRKGHRYLICTSMESVWSNKNLRFLTYWENGIS